MDAEQVRVVSLTVPDESTGRRIAEALVDGGLAACVQLGGPIESWYRWEGRVEHDREWTVTAKTSAAQLERVLERLESLHPYEVPEVLVVTPSGGSESYLRWVLEETGGTGDR